MPTYLIIFEWDEIPQIYGLKTTKLSKKKNVVKNNIILVLA